MIKVSVIIPTEKVNENLRRCLRAIEKQSYKNFEVIVIESQKSKFKSQNQNSKVKSFFCPELAGNPSGKRNWGARKAMGEILAFLDDDCVPEKSWVEAGIKSLESQKSKVKSQNYNSKVKSFEDEKHEIGAIVGPMLTPLNSPFWERMGGYLCESPLVFGDEVYRNKISSKREVSDYPSANFFIKKKDFLKLGRTSREVTSRRLPRCIPSGGFDERFWPGEDTKLCLEIVQSGGKIMYDPEVVVYHRRRPLFRPCTRRHMASPFLEQVARYGRQRGKFVRLFPQTSRKWYYFVPSLLVIFLMLCLIFWRWGIVLYLAVVLLEATRIGIKEKNVLMGIFFMIGVILTHMVYGLSFLSGLSYLGKKI